MKTDAPAFSGITDIWLNFNQVALCVASSLVFQEPQLRDMTGQARLAPRQNSRIKT